MIWPLGFAACQSKNRSGFCVLHTITSNNSFASAKVILLFESSKLYAIFYKNVVSYDREEVALGTRNV